MTVRVRPSCGVGSGGDVGVDVAVHKGFGVMLGVLVTLGVGVLVCVGVVVGVDVWVVVAVLAIVGVGAKVDGGTVMVACGIVDKTFVSAVGEEATATAVEFSPRFSTAPMKKSSMRNRKNEPSKPFLWLLFCAGGCGCCAI